MPMHVFNEWKKSELAISGIGDDVEDFESHLIRIAGYVDNDKKTSAIQEIQNTIMLLYNINNNRSALAAAYKCLLVNDEDKEKVNSLTLEELKKGLETVKKK